MAPTPLQLVKGYSLPGVFILASVFFYIYTAVTSPRLMVTNFQAFRNKAFANLWLTFAKIMADDTPKSVNLVLAGSRGIILDVGPGGGHQLFRFSNLSDITTIYGAEPGVELHGALQENAKKAGLGNKYKVLSCGAEKESLFPALEKEGLIGREKGSEGIFDEVVCIRVLCGVPKFHETVEGLYRCLKPGGRFIIFEHVLNDNERVDSKIARVFQNFYMALGWSFWLGGCQLTRNTDAALRKAAEKDGGWDEIKLEKVDTWSALPHIVASYTKKH